jgi:uncharacterized repeat protein (TIGR03803 family)
MTSKTQDSTHWNRIFRVRLREATLALATVLLTALVATGSAPAQTFSVLYTFKGGDIGGPGGSGPQADFLVRDHAGNLYGTTTYGGGGFNICSIGCGVAYKLDTAGKQTVLYAFAGPPGDAADSYAGLLPDAESNFDGTTCCGGTYNAGTVFTMDRTTGQETVLYSFTGGTDGAGPYAGLVGDEVGNLYGVTTGGGSYGQGTVFKVATTGKETVLYSFTGGEDGGTPAARLLRDNVGNLYGTTAAGGDLSCFAFSVGCGVVFELDRAGKETVLHKFTGTDGSLSFGGLVRDAADNFYGTTNLGGAYGQGTVFKLDKMRKETVLYSFTGGADGAQPYSGLVLDEAGRLFGTTYVGGDTSGFCGKYGGCGVVYKLDSNGMETVLHTFTGTDGLNPRGNLLPDEAGDLYGTASSGGDLSACGKKGCGVVFKIKLRSEM